MAARRRAVKAAEADTAPSPARLRVAPADFTHFPVGARVLVDGEVEARVRACWPHGTWTLLGPHYKVDILDGDKNVAVHYRRVGVVRKS